MTIFTRSTSIPRPNISVATKIRFSKALKAVYRLILLYIIEGKNLRDNSSSMKLHAPLILLQTRMDTDARKIAGDKELVQFDSSSDRFYENNNLERKIDEKKTTIVHGSYLVELQRVQQFIQLPIFSNFLKLHIMLL